MRRMVQTVGFVVIGAGTWAASGVAGAQSLKPAPELGQWEVRNQLLVNGKDVMADLR